MATDDEFVRLYNKKILPLDMFKDKFLDYLRNLIVDEQSNNFRTDVIFDTAVAVVPVGNNKINIAAAAAFRSVDGQGKTIKAGSTDSRLQNINIPVGAGNVFHVGLESNDVETGIETNPRTGEKEYVTFKEEIGRVGTPDLVTFGGGALTFRVNSVTESGEDHTGRFIRVWLKSRAEGGIGPLTLTEGSAIQTKIASFSTPNNEITTTDLFGQTGTPSTTASDYVIQLVGPTVRRLATEDLITATGVVFLAVVTSVAAATPIPGGNIVTTAQNVSAFSLSDFAEVLRRDSHDAVKVRVKADVSDDDEPQVEVQDSGGTTKWNVDEDGDSDGQRYLVEGGRGLIASKDNRSLFICQNVTAFTFTRGADVLASTITAVTQLDAAENSLIIELNTDYIRPSQANNDVHVRIWKVLAGFAVGVSSWIMVNQGGQGFKLGNGWQLLGRVQSNGTVNSNDMDEQFNIASVTKGATGIYTVNLIREMNSAGLGGFFITPFTDSTPDAVFGNVNSSGTTAIAIRMWDDAGAAIDVGFYIGVSTMR